MRKGLFLTSTLITLLLVGFLFFGCDDDSINPPNNKTDASLNGTWVDEDGVKLILDNGNFEFSGFMKGNYTTNGNNITLIPTHFHGDALNSNMGEAWFESKWYSKSDLKTSLEYYYVSDEELNDIFSSQTGTYSVSGSKLTLTFYGDSQIFTKVGSSGDNNDISNSDNKEISNLVYVGVVAFNAKTENFPLSNNLGQAKSFISNRKNDVDSTALCYAVSESIKLFDAPGLPALDNKFIVTFTDGDDNYSSALYNDVPYGREYDKARTDLLSKSGIKSYAIGFGTSLRENDLMKLVVNGGEYRNATNTTNLNQVFQDIANSVLASSKNVVLITQKGNYTETNPKYFKITVSASQTANGTIDYSSIVICKLAGKQFSIITPSDYITFDAPVTGTESGTKINIPLNNLKYTSGGKECYIRNIKVEISTSQDSGYRVDVEDSSASSDITKKIGVVIVLDCTTSLGSAFGPMKTSANNFIETLAKNTR